MLKSEPPIGMPSLIVFGQNSVRRLPNPGLALGRPVDGKRFLNATDYDHHLAQNFSILAFDIFHLFESIKIILNEILHYSNDQDVFERGCPDRGPCWSGPWSGFLVRSAQPCLWRFGPPLSGNAIWQYFRTSSSNF